MALAYAAVELELREVLLKDKPTEMLEASGKGTVPVLVLPQGEVIDESIDIMRWALAQGDRDRWLSDPAGHPADHWISANDGHFKHCLDRYKYADRHPEQPAEWYRAQTFPHLERLEQVLQNSPWLHGKTMGLADVALFPFLRQFAMVDRPWFDSSPYSALRQWLENWLDHALFQSVMQKRAPWEPGQKPVLLAS